MLEERILRTLKLFSVLGFASTLLELKRFLVAPEETLPDQAGDGELALSRLLLALEDLKATGRVVSAYGLYTLAETAQLLPVTWQGARFGSRREKRLSGFLFGVRYLPFVVGVALSGSQALGLQKKTSDIDLLVVVRSNWIWLTRFLVTVYFQVLGLRRHGTKTANRFCLNHYTVENKVMLSGQNWYTALEYAKLRPLVGGQAIFAFQVANQAWIKEFFPSWEPVRTLQEKNSPHLRKLFEKLLDNKIGRTLNNLLGKIQKKRIKPGEYIVVEEGELSFHPGSKESEVLSRFV